MKTAREKMMISNNRKEVIIATTQIICLSMPEIVLRIVLQGEGIGERRMS